MYAHSLKKYPESHSDVPIFVASLIDPERIPEKYQKISKYQYIFNKPGKRTLHDACTKNHIETVKFLLSCDIKPQRRSVNFAARRGYYEILKLLINCGKIDNSFDYSFDRIIESGEVDIALMMIKCGHLPNRNSLDIAIKNDQLEIVAGILKTLISGKKMIDDKEFHGKFFLHDFCGNKKLFKLVLSFLVTKHYCDTGFDYIIPNVRREKAFNLITNVDMKTISHICDRETSHVKFGTHLRGKLRVSQPFEQSDHFFGFDNGFNICKLLKNPEKLKKYDVRMVCWWYPHILIDIYSFYKSEYATLKELVEKEFLGKNL